ncbi:winged helix-turn-helix domain-containing protein [Paludibacterium yongneupense]|uniref:winged helix-turn-helix domain-containing protein n=1 Tax=Paludibacterium yongneupense TaxID=400061 RepID=UPI00048D5D78|nr:winged helix-turn-helix domain-containing protein [Paludibacterium yongneupense]
MSVCRVAADEYIFGEFVLSRHGVLYSRDGEKQLPPKEYRVLRALLDAEGGVVSKARLFARAWGHSDVGDESLTRCIYSLRRRLRQDALNRYIETVYGQGYRIMVAPSRSHPGRRLAVLPFSGGGVDLAGLHFRLIEHFRTVAGIDVVPSALTRDAVGPQAILALMRRLAPDFYLAGSLRRQGRHLTVNMELVDGMNHALLATESVLLLWDGHEQALDPLLAASIVAMMGEAGISEPAAI